MKRRYTILFYIALSPLIGLSWLGSRIGVSIWGMFNISLLGMLVAATAAGIAAKLAIQTKSPAIVAGVASIPMALEMLKIGASLTRMLDFIGPSLILIVFGSIATFVASWAIAVLAVPPPPRDPQVAPARVVD